MTGQPGDGRDILRVPLQNGELVAAQASERIPFAHDLGEPPRHRGQELVPDAVAERIVHALEVVEVQAIDGEPLARPAGLGVRLLQTILEKEAVG